MTTMMINIEEGHEEDFKTLLRNANFKTEVIESQTQVAEPTIQYQRIQKILDEAKGKELFKDIDDPSEWQRQIRKEWDRDF